MKRTALILVNLGTPDAPTPEAVRRYLKEFLSDQRVVELPKLLWWPILNGIILNKRPKAVAEAYASVWQEDSPLRLVSQQLAERLQSRFPQLTIDYAMTYGKPALKERLSHLAKHHDKLMILPLFPQYSGSTTAAVFDQVSFWSTQQRNLPELHLLRDYHDESAYINALAASVKQHWASHGRADLLLMSFHGIPQKYAKKGDPYPVECQRTAELLAQALDLEPSSWMMTFQSRFGAAPWLQPYTDKTLEKLGKGKKVKSVQVICPGFSADCLETLEEIDEENREIFLEAGGQRFEYIGALNAQDMALDAYTALVKNKLGL
ncbi:MAG: ferrochelatase [Pseudomonadota bacterium]|nr:ferrochelatase [Pseudomonadota bacterium]